MQLDFLTGFFRFVIDSCRVCFSPAPVSRDLPSDFHLHLFRAFCLRDVNTCFLSSLNLSCNLFIGACWSCGHFLCSDSNFPQDNECLQVIKVCFTGFGFLPPRVCLFSRLSLPLSLHNTHTGYNNKIQQYCTCFSIG